MPDDLMTYQPTPESVLELQCPVCGERAYLTRLALDVAARAIARQAVRMGVKPEVGGFAVVHDACGTIMEATRARLTPAAPWQPYQDFLGLYGGQAALSRVPTVD